MRANVRGVLLAWLALAVLLLVAVRAEAQTTYYGFANQGSQLGFSTAYGTADTAAARVACQGMYATSIQALRSQCLGSLPETIASSNPDYSYVKNGSSNVVGVTHEFYYDRYYQGSAVLNNAGSIRYSHVTWTCPAGQVATGVQQCAEMPSCDPDDPLVQQTAGQKFTAKNWQSLAAYSRDFCNAVTGCKTTVRQYVSIGGDALWVMEHTAEPCAGSEPAGPEQEDEQDSEQCTAIGSGEYCVTKAGDGQCGYLNDQFICLAKTPRHGCQAMADGSKVCGELAETPPAPDSGTPGVKAEPDATVEYARQGSTSTTEYHYYSAVTVAGSSRSGSTSEPVTEGPPGDSDGDGIADGEEGGGDGECSGDDCTSHLPGGGELEEVDTFGELTQAFWGRVQAAPVVAAVRDLSSALPAGVCPTGTAELAFIDATITLDAHCTLWEQVAPLLSGVMLAVWGLLGVRIIMSA